MKKKGIKIDLPENLIGIEVSTTPYDYLERKELIPSNVSFSHGAGPWCLDEEWYVSAEDARERLLDCFKKFKGDFIGEAGLDFHWNYGSKKDQTDLFRVQIEISEELNVPIIIHSRDADKELLEILNGYNFSASGIMHCFSSDITLAKAALDKGLYISFAGNVTYKSNTSIQEAAKYVPLDRILYETDSPYLSPIPLRGKPNTPENTDITSEFIADLRAMSTEKLREAAIENFYTLSRISSSQCGEKTI